MADETPAAAWTGCVTPGSRRGRLVTMRNTTHLAFLKEQADLIVTVVRESLPQ